MGYGISLIQRNTNRSKKVKNMIIDSHAHVFPHLGSRAGYRSEQKHLDAIQYSMHTHLAQPVKRKCDHVIVKNDMLWDAHDSSIKGKRHVDFKVTKHGRFEWTADGVDYYIHYMPPSLQNMEASPEFLKVMMEYAGIDRAVLQCASVYGKLNSYYVNIIQEYGDLFIPLYQPDESRAYCDDELEQLHVFEKLGFQAIWFPGFMECFGKQYRPFWDLVQEKRLPVFWSFHPAHYDDLHEPFLEWLEAYPETTNIVAQSFPLSTLEKDGEMKLPEYAKILREHQNVLFELAYPIAEGNREDYPYPKSRQAVAVLYDFFGAERLVWGSDIPNVERYCTYAQSLNYLKNYCTFIPRSDLDLILGGNLNIIFPARGDFHV